MHAIDAEPLVEVRRGPLIESCHLGHIAVVDGTGRLIASIGDPGNVTYMRSSAKPFQALPFVTTGAADRFEFGPKELAVACASHNGEPLHTATVTGILAQIGLDHTALLCGIHAPFGAEAARMLREQGAEPSTLHNNCSGKHAAFLAVAVHLGLDTADYLSPEHQVQQDVLQSVSRLSDIPQHEIATAVDGCVAPIFALPIAAMARMFARLVSPPVDFDDRLSSACSRIVAAMAENPEMIGGQLNERLDTEVMRAAGGRVISKVGAEGVYAAGVLPSKVWPAGLGIAFKIADGENMRARPTVVVEILRQLGLLDDKAGERLKPFARFPIRNHRGDTVGEVVPNFRLKWH
jgi:L-asparaginase II